MRMEQHTGDGLHVQKILAREQYRALFVLSQALPYWRIMTVADLPQDSICSGFMAFFSESIPNRGIPHDDSWYWSQGGGREKVTVSGVTVSMRKLISRRFDSGSGGVFPTCKCWVFDILAHVPEQGWEGPLLPRGWSFLWCEKGFESYEEYLWYDALPWAALKQ